MIQRIRYIVNHIKSMENNEYCEFGSPKMLEQSETPLLRHHKYLASESPKIDIENDNRIEKSLVHDAQLRNYNYGSGALQLQQKHGDYVDIESSIKSNKRYTKEYFNVLKRCARCVSILTGLTNYLLQFYINCILQIINILLIHIAMLKYYVLDQILMVYVIMFAEWIHVRQEILLQSEQSEICQTPAILNTYSAVTLTENEMYSNRNISDLI